MESVLRAKNYTWCGNHTSFKHQGGGGGDIFTNSYLHHKGFEGYIHNLV